MKPHLAASRRGFTLIELLVVVAVIGILLAVSIPAFVPMMRTANINRSAAMVIDEFNQARQFALTRNRDIEVRFYQLPKKSGGSKQYRALRTFMESKPLGKIKYLPEPSIISDSSTFSTLFDCGNSKRSGLVQSTETIPNISGPVNYISFMFRANGGTSLAPVAGTDSNWFLTLYLEDAEKDAATQLPANYYNIQVDSATGRVRSYRP